MSKTIENLMAGFAGESQARNKYTFYAKVARKEGFHYIAKLFEETAENERQHASDQFKMAGHLGDTIANLRAAAEGEAFETDSMYPEFARVAEEEGNKEAASLFRHIAKVEAHHCNRYLKLLKLVEDGSVFERQEEIMWKCSKCGHTHTGKNPPKVCPCCKHEYNYFEPADMETGLDS